jgi:hypothetical protein
VVIRKPEHFSKAPTKIGWSAQGRGARTGVELEAVGFGDALEVPHEELLAAALALARELGASLGQVVLRHAQRMPERLFELLHLRAQLCSILVPAHRADTSQKRHNTQHTTWDYEIKKKDTTNDTTNDTRV